MTLDKLARMIAEGFDKIATKEEVNFHFDSVENRLGSVEQRLDKVEQRLGKVEYQVGEIHDLVGNNEKDVLNLKVRVNKLEDNVKILSK